MSPGFAGVFAEAGALWRGERDLWVRIATFFFFLPTFAIRLFVPTPDTRGQGEEAAAQLTLDWLAGNAGWLAGQLLVQMLGTGVVLVLLLDPARPSLGEAIARALRLLPGLLLVGLGATLLVTLGLVLLVLPGLYAVGRTFVAGAAYVAEPGRGPLGALIAGIRRTENRGWMLLLVSMTVIAVNYITAATAGGVERGLVEAGVDSPLVRAPFEALMSLAAAAVALAQVLLQAAAYRRLEAPRQGI